MDNTETLLRDISEPREQLNYAYYAVSAGVPAGVMFA